MFKDKQWDRILCNEDEIDKLIRDNYAAIYKYSFCHIRNREDAQDITQEVFLKFVKSLDKYLEYGKAKNYLYVIAGNCIKDHFKKLRPSHVQIEEGYDGGLGDIPDRLVVSRAIDSLGSSWGVFLTCMIITLRISGFEIYTEKNFIGWVFLGVIAFFGSVFELRKIMKRVGGTVDEINNGAFI